MALTKKDLSLIKDLLVENNKDLRAEWRSDLHTALDRQAQNIKRDIRNEMDARFSAFETKMNYHFAEIHADIQEVVTILFTFVPERFEKLEYDMTRVKAHIGLA